MGFISDLKENNHWFHAVYSIVMSFLTKPVVVAKVVSVY